VRAATPPPGAVVARRDSSWLELVFEIVPSLAVGGVVLRPVVVSHGSEISPNISRMNRPSPIVDKLIRALTE